MSKQFFLALLTAVAACHGPAVQQDGVAPAATGAASAAATITPGDMYARIAFLASDALRGRDTPSPGLEAAAAYIASEFKRFGLEPHGDNGTYFQRYDFTVRTVHADSTRLSVKTRGETSSYALGSDIFAWAGEVAHSSGSLVFVGTSMPAAAGSLRDRIPLIFIGGALDRAWRTAVMNARNAARDAGANALIVVVDPAITSDDIRQRATLFSTSIAVTPVASTIFLRYDRARELLHSAGQNLDAMVARAKGAGLSPVSLANTTAHVAIPVAEVIHHPPNVVAVLPGSDPELRNTYVVLSGHMDHIGVGRPNERGDSINNGADDDASGTSAVVEIAEALASLPTRPARSIIFLTVSGEEKGLLGSQYFSEHPVVPLGSIVANINMDMIGRNAPDSIVAIGQDYSSLGPLTQEVARSHPELRLTVSRDIWPQERFFFRSDHYNFARKEIPAIFFFAGVHEDYHRPSDEVEKIDADKAARVARLAYYLASEIANRREPPKWTASGLQEVRTLTR
jgi:hypothetical protein